MSATAPKRIVVLSDGTGNSSAKLIKTNVWRMYEAIDLAAGDQIALYDNGVGTSSFRPLAILGGAIGWGLKRNVLSLYTFICRNYSASSNPSGPPEIYAFGFSRGAFTIRVLGALIQSQGLVASAKGRELDRLARWAYRAYRREYNPTGGLVSWLRGVRDWLLRQWERKPIYAADGNARPRITFMGLWDTVDAYGLPIDEMTRGWDEWVWPLSLGEHACPPIVDKACHAVALDDERHTFHPLLFDETNETPCPSIKDERVTQVWFSGMHSNVGGGYPDDSLAMVPLLWMADQACRKGLRLHRQVQLDWGARADPNGPMSDSRRGLAAYYRYNPRHMKRLTNDRFAEVCVSLPKIHESVFTRIARGRDDYAPIVLPEHYAIVTSSGQVLTAPQNPHESATQSRSRCADQERVWNLVWQRRIAYFATVIVTFLLIVPPFLFGIDGGGVLTWTSASLSGLIEAIGGTLPSVAKPWVDYYHRFPVQLVVGVAMVAGLLGFSTSLQRAMRDGMRSLWDGILSAPRREIQPSATPTDWIYRLRSSNTYRQFFEIVTQHVFPFVFGIAALLTLVMTGVGTANRSIFAVASAVGVICRDVSPVVRWDGVPRELTFETRELCHQTGLVLRPSSRYRVTVREPDTWFDGSIPVATQAGFGGGRRPLVFVPSLPFRRILAAQWYVPIARIGSHTAEYHYVDQGTVEFTPRHEGQLFFFVNDAVGPPWRFGWLYENNRGITHVAVEELVGLSSTRTPTH